MNRLKYIAGIALIGFLIFGTAGATDFGLGISGTKTFRLNAKIAPPELKFHSSAPLEDIPGYVGDPSKITSTVKLNMSDIESSSGKVSFKVDALKTGIDLRDQHLREENWLDSKNYPDISFELRELKFVTITSVDAMKGRSVAEATALGVFRMHGKAKEMRLPIKLTLVKASAETAKRAPGNLFFIEGSFRITLKDFDVKGSQGTIGSKVGESVRIDFKLYYNSN